ncbi:hypothetical protein EVAR_634_1 [Eumeta japonica]|uniref:Uncharacterized protein n=1 Tax=Eumeta variegata TaxID=151549 RepID=A0A4C1SE98_EUMVA|nr:hypothetical protein EVAR_634_1 [Eumeta japonica]
MRRFCRAIRVGKAAGRGPPRYKFSTEQAPTREGHQERRNCLPINVVANDIRALLLCDNLSSNDEKFQGDDRLTPDGRRTQRRAMGTVRDGLPCQKIATCFVS